MFGFLISGPVNDDAVRLRSVMEFAKKECLHLDGDALRDLISKRYPGDQSCIGEREYNFVDRTTPDFQFSFMKFGDAWNFAAHGKGKYAGYMLAGSKEGNWFSTVSDGVAYRATGGAKKLARVIQSKYGIKDMTKRLGRL